MEEKSLGEKVEDPGERRGLRMKRDQRESIERSPGGIRLSGVHSEDVLHALTYLL